MMKKLFAGAFSVLSVLLAVVAAAAVICFENGAVLNNYLGISTGEIVNPDGVAGPNYYRSAYGDGSFTDENLDLLVADTYAQNVAEEREGAALLKNDGALPLANDERKVELFGQYVTKAYHSGSGDNNVELRAALEMRGFTIGAGASVAIVMLSRSAGEGQELSASDRDGNSGLALKDSERETLISAKSSHEKVIVLINASNPMEVEWLFEPETAPSACLWIGGPGLRGFIGVVDILVGDVSPSGRLTDTYAAVSTSAPACVNGATNSPRWQNVSYLQANTTERMSSVAFYSVQVENIYVGYKYYETRYEDKVLNRFGAGSGVGATAGGGWDYACEVTFPFGFGLSYTRFEQELVGVTEKDGELIAEVKVRNVGDYDGKCVVQVYAQTPYGAYEIENGIEKSAVTLVGFGKTPPLEKHTGEATVFVSVDKYFLASYDYRRSRGYVLTAGEYYLAIGDDAHDALNNILAHKGADGLTDADGNAVLGDTAKVYAWTEAFDDTSYRYSVGKGEVTNRFDDCDINYWIDSAATYLTRSDWAGTFPTEPVALSITDDMIKIINGATYEKPADAPDFSEFEIDADKGITAVEMMGVDYDDPKWDEFISQLSLEELTSFLAGAFSKDQVDSIVLPPYFSGDGIDKLSANFKTANPALSRDEQCCRYCDEIVLASTFNAELYKERGRLMGEEMLFCGFYTLYGPGGDLHRTPFGGRNCEYASEDANLTYIFNAEFMKGLRSKGVVAQVKHLAGNDSEYNRAGISLFFTEQAWREGSLRGFEGAFTEGGAAACMNGLNRIGLRWTNASEALCTGVLREEWGLKGTVGSDGISSTYQTHFTTTVAAGSDSFCLDNKGTSSKAMLEYLTETRDGYMLMKVREAAKHNLYPLVNSNVMNGLTEHSTISRVTPWWSTAFTAAIVALSVLTAAALALCIVFGIRGRKSK